MISNLTRFEALKLAVEAYGTHEAAALQLGVHQSTVSRWLKQSKRLPAEYVLKVEADTGLSRHLLRPDVYPVETNNRFYGVDQGVERVSFQNGGILQRNTEAGEAA